MDYLINPSAYLILFDGSNNLFLCVSFPHFEISLLIEYPEISSCHGAKYGGKVTASVSFEGRQDLLGHSSSRIKPHYPRTELGSSLRRQKSACNRGKGKPELVILQRLSAG